MTLKNKKKESQKLFLDFLFKIPENDHNLHKRDGLYFNGLK